MKKPLLLISALAVGVMSLTACATPESYDVNDRRNINDVRNMNVDYDRVPNVDRVPGVNRVRDFDANDRNGLTNPRIFDRGLNYPTGDSPLRNDTEFNDADNAIIDSDRDDTFIDDEDILRNR